MYLKINIIKEIIDFGLKKKKQQKSCMISESDKKKGKAQWLRV